VGGPETGRWSGAVESVVVLPPDGNCCRRTRFEFSGSGGWGGTAARVFVEEYLKFTAARASEARCDQSRRWWDIDFYLALDAIEGTVRAAPQGVEVVDDLQRVAAVTIFAFCPTGTVLAGNTFRVLTGFGRGLSRGCGGRQQERCCRRGRRRSWARTGAVTWPSRGWWKGTVVLAVGQALSHREKTGRGRAVRIWVRDPGPDGRHAIQRAPRVPGDLRSRYTIVVCRESRSCKRSVCVGQRRVVPSSVVADVGGGGSDRWQNPAAIKSADSSRVGNANVARLVRITN